MTMIINAFDISLYINKQKMTANDLEFDLFILRLSYAGSPNTWVRHKFRLSKVSHSNQLRHGA